MTFGDELEAKPQQKFVINHGQRFDYQVRSLPEGALGTILLGRSSIKPHKLNNILNEMSAKGYRNTFQVLERKRMLIFWTRESLLLTFVRSLV